jgi:site-specific recombinase XerD
LQQTPSLNGRGVRSTYTVKGYIEVIKNFLSWAEQEELVDEKVRKRVPNPKVEQKVIRILSREQFALLLAASDLEPSRMLQLRDRALLCVLLATGIRASELCGLRLCDLDMGADFIRVRGKGKKQREIGPMGQTCLKHLRRYLRGTEVEGSGNPEAPVFVSRRTGAALTPDGIDQLIKRLRDHAGDEFFAGIRVSAHTFRHTFAVNFLKQGGNIKQLQLLLGHTSLAVTQRYLEDFQARDARRGQSVLDNL